MRVRNRYIENENRMHCKAKKNAVSHGWRGFEDSATHQNRLH
jgi:hypothetical protein